MALLFFDGFQDADLMTKPEWNVAWPTAGVGRDGSTSGSAAMTSGTRYMTLPGSGAATCVAGIAVKLPSLAATNFSVLQFCSSAGTIQLALDINASGLIDVHRTSASGTIIGTSSGHTPVGAGEWHYYEMKATLTTATTSTVTVRLDGVTVLTITGVATSSVTGNVTNVQIVITGAATPNFDDMYVCDTTDGTATDGRANSDFLGDVRVQTLLPSAAGDSTGWTPLSGANYTNVDEVPANSTDYVSSSVSTTRDLYTLADLTGLVSTVYAVREHLYASKSDAGSVTIKPVLKESGGTITAETAQAPGTQFAIISGPMKTVKPSGGVWTATDVNGLQAGMDIG